MSDDPLSLSDSPGPVALPVQPSDQSMAFRASPECTYYAPSQRRAATCRLRMLMQREPGVQFHETRQRPTLSPGIGQGESSCFSCILTVEVLEQLLQIAQAPLPQSCPCQHGAMDMACVQRYHNLLLFNPDGKWLAIEAINAAVSMLIYVPYVGECLPFAFTADTIREALNCKPPYEENLELHFHPQVQGEQRTFELRSTHWTLPVTERLVPGAAASYLCKLIK